MSLTLTLTLTHTHLHTYVDLVLACNHTYSFDGLNSIPLIFTYCSQQCTEQTRLTASRHLYAHFVREMYMLVQGNIMDVFHRGTDGGRARNPAAVTVDYSQLQVVQQDKWTYQMLVESRPLQQYLDAIVTRARVFMEQLQLLSAQVHIYCVTVVVMASIYTTFFFFFLQLSDFACCFIC